MKLSIAWKGLLPALALLVSTSAFAANKGSFDVNEPLSVNGFQLAPGRYQVQWEGTGPSVQVSILSEGKLVTTATARLIELNRKGDDDATVVGKNGDGPSTLQGIDFARKNYELDFHTVPPAMESATQGNQ